VIWQLNYCERLNQQAFRAAYDNLALCSKAAGCDNWKLVGKPSTFKLNYQLNLIQTGSAVCVCVLSLEYLEMGSV